ncbi:GNAT family N-acetyltransferase [Thalassotalea sp. LPB0316]|uniref:GNAT family N-acetyltransferase n=1 Tax=Thalassotalea sp. LPB0316 TaxID=2769490 RepID=UPI001868A57F|nr:GNAT family N-acetyltransferase [Thalassotalea sp. LPB0316]QOL24303.1 GNAT family N-acetyltransferase [Thalassotalea sp. LPB0316]
MTEHLAKAGIVMDDVRHLARIDEFFSDSMIIEYKNVSIGVIKLGKFSDRLHIRQLQIMPKYQGKGVGAKVIQQVIKRAVALNLPVSLYVLKQNPAKRLYQRLGFVIESETDLEYFMKLSIDC